MQQHTSATSPRILSHWVLGVALCALGGMPWAQTVPPSGASTSAPMRTGEPLPPRLVLCQREVGAQAGGDRQRLMRACLARRLEGERVVQRHCKRQASGVSGAQARQSAQADCERQALSVASAELARRPVATARPSPAPANAPARRPSPVVPTGTGARAPAAGEH